MLAAPGAVLVLVAPTVAGVHLCWILSHSALATHRRVLAMTERSVDFEARMLEHAERQTDAIEDVQRAAMIFLALAIIGLVIGAAAAFG